MKIGWRNLRKRKLFSFINILGLSIGIALCFIIMLYVQDELSYDKYNKNAQNIARISFRANINSGKIDEAGVMAPVAKAVKDEYPEVKDATRLMPYGTPKISIGNNVFKDDQVAFADNNFFQIFTLPFISGDPSRALEKPNTVVLSKTIAEKYFGKTDPIGKTIRFNDKDLYQVTGVMEDVPANSHFHFEMFASLEGFDAAKSDSWMSGNYHTYLLLRPGTNLANLESKFPAMVEKYMGPQIQQAMGLSLSQFRTKGNELGFVLLPLTDIHLHPITTTELEPGGNASYVYIFGGIALFMLIVACINFINLSTANASKRAREVGVRKVAGSGRWQLVSQFLCESLLVSALSIVIAFGMVEIALPAFNHISGKELAMNYIPALALIGMGLFTGLLAGIYPAFVLSSFRPVAVLKGPLHTKANSFNLRSGLVVFQFFISVGLIICTIIVYQQMKYIQNKDLGYDKEQVLTLPNSWALGANERAYKQEMLGDTRILNATSSWYKPAGPTNNNNALAYPRGNDQLLVSGVDYHVDEAYIPTLGMKILSGRNFSKDYKTDSFAIILNEQAAHTFGWTRQNAVGQTVIRQNSDRGDNVAFHVIGVVQNFNFKSLHEAISPLFMSLNPEGGLMFKVKTADMPALLADMKKRWDAFNTGEPFTYSFLDDLYEKTYSQEQRTGTVLNTFAILTIFVACLGLFGLVTYTAEQRRKEIGVRKVLGASVGGIVSMLSKDFARLVLIASLAAFPVAWWAMHKWLESFAFRIDIRWWVFLLAGTIALFIALITVSFQSIKAAVANPGKSLRTE